MDWIPKMPLPATLFYHLAVILIGLVLFVRYAWRREWTKTALWLTVTLELFTSIPVRLVHSTYNMDGTVAAPKATPSPP